MFDTDPLVTLPHFASQVGAHYTIILRYIRKGATPFSAHAVNEQGAGKSGKQNRLNFA